MSDFQDEDLNDEDEEERYIPPVREVLTLENALDPTPPIGWLKMFSYDTDLPVSPTEAASWMICLFSVQQWEQKQSRVRLAHMISRDQCDRRWLIVHPDFREEAESMVDTLNGIVMYCNCGGYCIEPVLQQRAALLFARRACTAVDPSKLEGIFELQDLPVDLLRWADLSVPQRAKLICCERLDPEAISEDRHWLDVIRPDAGLFDTLAREMFDAGYDIGTLNELLET